MMHVRARHERWCSVPCSLTDLLFSGTKHLGVLFDLVGLVTFNRGRGLPLHYVEGHVGPGNSFSSMHTGGEGRSSGEMGLGRWVDYIVMIYSELVKSEEGPNLTRTTA